MSETAQSTVRDVEEDLEALGADDNHTPIQPADNHTPIAPEGEKAKKSDDEDDITVLDNHTPIAPA